MRVSCQRGRRVRIAMEKESRYHQEIEESLSLSLSISFLFSRRELRRHRRGGGGRAERDAGCGTRVSRVPITRRRLLTRVHRYARVMSLSIKPPRRARATSWFIPGMNIARRALSTSSDYARRKCHGAIYPPEIPPRPRECSSYFGLFLRRELLGGDTFSHFPSLPLSFSYYLFPENFFLES